MDEQTAAQPAERPTARAPTPSRRKSMWTKIRGPLVESRFAKATITSLIAQGLRLIKKTNPLAPGSTDLYNVYEDEQPFIIALWHGQHILAPVFYPPKRGLVAMVSRSADAELNAMVVEKFGIGAVRGSGGRDAVHRLDKGGARALVALKKALDDGNNVCMIADIPHGTPRDAGLGIVLLARISGRPIIPMAFATSRRKVLEQSWDKTTIFLPFGKGAVAVGDLIYVPKDADDAELERKRILVTERLNATTAHAYALADGEA